MEPEPLSPGLAQLANYRKATRLWVRELDPVVNPKILLAHFRRDCGKGTESYEDSEDSEDSDESAISETSETSEYSENMAIAKNTRVSAESDEEDVLLLPYSSESSSQDTVPTTLGRKRHFAEFDDDDERDDDDVQEEEFDYSTDEVIYHGDVYDDDDYSDVVEYEGHNENANEGEADDRGDYVPSKELKSSTTDHDHDSDQDTYHTLLTHTTASSSLKPAAHAWNIKTPRDAIKRRRYTGGNHFTGVQQAASASNPAIVVATPEDERVAPGHVSFFDSLGGFNLAFLKGQNRWADNDSRMNFPLELLTALDRAYRNLYNKSQVQPSAPDRYHPLRIYTIVVEDSRTKPAYKVLDMTMSMELATERALETFRHQFEGANNSVFQGIVDNARRFKYDVRNLWREADAPELTHRDLIWWVDDCGLLSLTVADGHQVVSVRVVERKIELTYNANSL